jgi:hypothetical protein
VIRMQICSPNDLDRLRKKHHYIYNEVARNPDAQYPFCIGVIGTIVNSNRSAETNIAEIKEVLSVLNDMRRANHDKV